MDDKEKSKEVAPKKKINKTWEAFKRLKGNCTFTNPKWTALQ